MQGEQVLLLQNMVVLQTKSYMILLFHYL